MYSKIVEYEGISEYRLESNNLKILLSEQRAAPVVALMVVYRVGSRNEAVGNTGATHLLEHMLFKGTPTYNKKNGTQIAAVLQKHGAIFNAEVQRVARHAMREHAQQHRLQVLLGSRDRLDVIVLESASSPQMPVSINVHAGVRMGIATSVMGWALLAALPELERYYLLEGVQRRMPRDWARIRRRCSEAVAQVYQRGWCATPADADQEVGMVAAPLLMEGHAPMVLACVGASQQMTRARVERELGPRLLALATQIQQGCQA